MEQTQPKILESVEQYATRILREETPSDLEYHDYQHTYDVVAAAREIGMAEGLSVEEMEVLLIAAWFHDTGHIERVSGHEEASKDIAARYLLQQGYDPARTELVKSAITATCMPQAPVNKIEEVLCDADLAHLANKSFMEKTALLRREWHAVGPREYSDEEWIKENVEFISKHQYFTRYGQEVLEKKKRKNLKKLDKKKEKLEGQKDEMLASELGVDPEELKRLKKKLKKVEGRPERGIETMFRVTSKNHIDLSSMADSKANIMISVNSIIISIIIGVLMRKLDSNPHLIVPTLILLCVCLSAIVFAILATRPNITAGKFTKEDIEQKRANLLFFGNFHKMKLADYEWGMRRLLEDSDYLYGSMIRDIYFLGTVLGKKYRFLRISYTIFMWGLIIASAAFIIAVMVYGDGTPDSIDNDTF